MLDGVSLEIAAGESVALLGANGSGKTTTLRCVIGLARPDRGRISIDGIDVARAPLRARARMSYLPQKPVFPGTLSVRETLRVVARLRSTDPGVVDRELEECGLRSLADRSVGQLSGGERQRLAMAVAFLPSVDLYLFDEASSNLDPAALGILVSRARQLKRDGRTLLFTTHVPADLRRLASRAIVLRNGRIESDHAGTFERSRNRPHDGSGRCEYLLERELWGDDDEDAMCDGSCGDRVAVDARLRGRGAVA